LAFLIGILCILGIINLVSSIPLKEGPASARARFTSWMIKHKIHYSNDEERNIRFEIFKKIWHTLMNSMLERIEVIH